MYTLWVWISFFASLQIVIAEEQCTVQLIGLKIISNKQMICGTLFHGMKITEDYMLSSSVRIKTVDVSGKTYVSTLSNKVCVEHMDFSKRGQLSPKKQISLCDTLNTNKKLGNVVFQELLTHQLILRDNNYNKKVCNISFSSWIANEPIITYDTKYVECATSNKDRRPCQPTCSSLALGEGGIFKCSNRYRQQLAYNAVTLQTGPNMIFIDRNRELCFTITASFTRDIGRMNGHKQLQFRGGSMNCVGQFVTDKVNYMCIQFNDMVNMSKGITLNQTLAFTTFSVDGSLIFSKTNILLQNVKLENATKVNELTHPVFSKSTILCAVQVNENGKVISRNSSQHMKEIMFYQHERSNSANRINSFLYLVCTILVAYK